MKKCAAFGLALILGFSFVVSPVGAISEAQKIAIMEKCDTIKDSLKNVQKLDARTRVFFGSHFETVLSKFITPLNLRLVENNMSDVDLIEIQNKFSSARVNFTVDYISYQQGLEELVAMNCKEAPENFYEKLKNVREKREVMTVDIAKIRELILTDINLVNQLLERIR